VAAGLSRPLARDKEQARRLYKERRALYELAALRVQINEEADAGMVAEEIVSVLALRTMEDK
jgi:shikimate kinase